MLKHYLDKGGNVLVMLGEGGELKYDTNINYLLEDYGIMVNSGASRHLLNTWNPLQLLPFSLLVHTMLLSFTTDAVVRNVYYKYFHPKEALVSNGVLNRLVSVSHWSSVHLCILQVHLHFKLVLTNQQLCKNSKFNSLLPFVEHCTFHFCQFFLAYFL